MFSMAKSHPIEVSKVIVLHSLGWIIVARSVHQGMLPTGGGFGWHLSTIV